MFQDRPAVGERPSDARRDEPAKHSSAATLAAIAVLISMVLGLGWLFATDQTGQIGIEGEITSLNAQHGQAWLCSKDC